MAPTDRGDIFLDAKSLKIQQSEFFFLKLKKITMAPTDRGDIFVVAKSLKIQQSEFFFLKFPTKQDAQLNV